jgi:ferredoxin
MKVKLNRGSCIFCGLSTETCPEVFRIAEDGLAEAYQENVPAEAESKAVEAQDGCPRFGYYGRIATLSLCPLQKGAGAVLPHRLCFLSIQKLV